jgi:molecular chaperone GrpE
MNPERQARPLTGEQLGEPAVTEAAMNGVGRDEAGADGGGPDVVPESAEGAAPAAPSPDATTAADTAPEAGRDDKQQTDPQGDERRLELDLDELAVRAGKADEYLELAQRTRADFENYRKRASREVAGAQERGIARLAKELLPAIDNLDRAVQAVLASAPEAEENSPAPDPQLVSGLRLVHADVLAALARVGIEPFSPEGEPFDPQYHEAVAQAPHEGTAPGTVVEVFQVGYRIGDTVLRPARVLVAA